MVEERATAIAKVLPPKRRWIQPMRVLHDRIWSAAQSAAGL
jgi:hypothetical protein